VNRGEFADANPSLAILAARLLVGTQDEIFSRLRTQGFADLRPRHGAILGYLDPEGSRASELARLAGMHKQRMAVALDELEAAGYVRRSADPTDRRAKIVIPTAQGVAAMWAGEAIIAEITRSHSEALGPERFASFLDMMREITMAQWRWRERHTRRPRVHEQGTLKQKPGQAPTDSDQGAGRSSHSGSEVELGSA
jgi:DNA-binding MarR family transcriptional regulator